MHFPQDMPGGWPLGMLTLFLFLKYERPFPDWWVNQSMRKYANCKIEGSALQKVGRYIFGVIGLFTVYLGPDVLFALFAPDASLAGHILRYIRYTLVSLWAIFAAPDCSSKSD